jgi:hypothetical protein
MSELSNINEVQKQANKYGVGKVFPSSRKNKKYMVQSPKDGMIHFGLAGAADFTGHKNEDRRQRFRQRNKKWATAARWSPAWLSYYLLW